MADHNIVKNGRYTVEITELSSDGSGVGLIDGFIVFVPLTAPGDTAEIVVVKVLSTYAIGRMLRLLRASAARVEAKCPVYRRCGGCRLQHIEYGEQVELKRGFIESAMRRIGGFHDFVCEQMLSAPEHAYRYRNKCVFPVGLGKDGGIEVGFYANRSHEIIPTDDCVAGDESNAAIVSAVTDYMRESGATPYDERAHTGLVRRIFIRSARVSGEIMAVVSVNGNNIPQRERLIKRLRAASDRIVSIYININKERTNAVLGRTDKLIYGKPTISDVLCGIKFEISPHSFYQVNPYMTERLYEKALEYADIRDSDTVLDVYCGIGAISLAAAMSAKKVIGIEIVERAVTDARENATANGIKNAEFFAQSAETAVPMLIERGLRPDKVILDPPRKGSDERTLTAIANAAPQRIVYVSCNPATLARDVKFLRSAGYVPTKACGADMFPQTPHVETVVLMSRVKE